MKEEKWGWVGKRGEGYQVHKDGVVVVVWLRGCGRWTGSGVGGGVRVGVGGCCGGVEGCGCGCG